MTYNKTYSIVFGLLIRSYTTLPIYIITVYAMFTKENFALIIHDYLLILSLNWMATVRDKILVNHTDYIYMNIICSCDWKETARDSNIDFYNIIFSLSLLSIVIFDFEQDMKFC